MRDQSASGLISRGKRLLIGLAALCVVGLGISMAATAGVGGVILLMGLVVLLVGGFAVVRGRTGWAHVGSRPIGLGVALAGLGLFVVGGALTPSVPAASRSALAISSAAPSSSSTMAESSAPPVLPTVVAPTTAAPTTAAPLPTTAALTPPAPVAITTTHSAFPPPPARPKAYGAAPRTQAPVYRAPVPPPVVVAPPPQPVPVPGGSLGTAPVQKPPSGNFYRAGEFCPAVDSGKTTLDSHGRSLICTDNNGLRWEYA